MSSTAQRGSGPIITRLPVPGLDFHHSPGAGNRAVTGGTRAFSTQQGLCFYASMIGRK